MRMSSWSRFSPIAFCLLALTGCGGGEWHDGRRTTSAATIAEGRAAVQDAMAATKATAMSVALVEDGRLAWSEAFGVVDKTSGRAATPGTLFSIASVSKTFATAALMLLVDQGKVDLDEPVTTYVPAFSMPLDPRYRDITVRMLLNHSSGLPGNDPRGSITTSSFPGYSAQVMDGLRSQRLKHDPGFISCYNNDGFTMVENVVKAVSGQSYTDFVRQNLLVPLGMDTSRYMVEPLPEGAFAKPYGGDNLLPLYTYNVYATGGLFSSTEDMARFATVIMGKGLAGSRRILSEKAVLAMGQAQRLGSFDPVPCTLLSFGLAWDTVALPCLSAVGVQAWQKGGDLENYYGATLVVVPEERLAVVVLGASNSFSSTWAGKVAERILLRALAERGRISGMPAQLTGTELPVQVMAPTDRDAFAGIYASNSVICRVRFGSDGALSLDKYSDGWTNSYKDMKLRSDGWFAAQGDPLSGLRLLTRGGRAYVALRMKYGYGHYQVQTLYAQRLDPGSAFSAAWEARRAERWMPVNGDPTDFLLSAADPTFRFRTVEGLDGYLLADTLLRNASPASETRLDGMFQTLPDGVRDLVDATAETWNSETWLKLGTRLFRPLSTVPALPSGTSTLVIGGESYTEWRKLPSSGRITINGAACWSLHDSMFAQLATGTGTTTLALSGTGTKWLALLGPKGAAVNLKLEP